MYSKDELGGRLRLFSARRSGIKVFRIADTTPEIPRLPGEADPTSLAAAQLAAGIHQDFLSELRSAEPVDFEQRLAGHAEQYPRILFGAVATHIAGVELPTDATVADRTQAVVEALRRIISTPRLFEAVTGASFQESAALQHQLDITTSKDEAEVTAAKELRAAIAECGFLDQSMIPGGRTVQLQYAGTQKAKRRRFRDDLPEISQEVVLKVVPATNRMWTVQTYGHWDSENGYAEPLGEREVPLTDVFTLLAVESSGLRRSDAESLERMVGTSIRLGRVSTGTRLKIDCHFTRVTREVPGYEPDIQHGTWTKPLTLQQAYLGQSRRQPLFWHPTGRISH